jgi:excisionase family DNA binding protein
LSRKKIASDKDYLIKCLGMEKEADRLLSTAEVAAQLGVSRQRILELITEDRLPARKVGRSYIIRAADVDSLKLYEVGRPPKPSDTPKRATGQKNASNGPSSKKGGKK